MTSPDAGRSRPTPLPFRLHPLPPGHPAEANDDPAVRFRQARAAARARDATRVDTLRTIGRDAGLPAVPCALVPTNERPLVPLPDGLREAFVERLRAELAALAREHAAQGERDGPDVSAWPAFDDETARLLGGACAVCRGACCATAGEHAWLRGAWLPPVRAAAAALDDDAFIARYVARFPAEHHDGSCVFHGAHGCVLPAEIRSPLCNHYWCDALVALERDIAVGPPPPPDADGVTTHAIVGAADGEALRRAGALRTEGVRHLPVHGDAERTGDAHGPDAATRD